MSDKCCNRIGVQSTHWEGCHEVHPSCAAYKAGYEAGMREAAALFNDDLTSIYGQEADIPAIRNAILAAIGEGE